jgi:hypothetical protein
LTTIYHRRARPLVVEALEQARIVFLAGARQVGKTTLVQGIVGPGGERPMDLVTLDDQAARQAAADDPAGFVAGLGRAAAIDEVQHVPQLLVELKKVVDSDQTPGRFLVTGSANVLSSRKVLDTLPGRVDRIELWPLARAEVEGGQLNFFDELFAGRAPHVTNAPVGPDAYSRYVTEGGYAYALDSPVNQSDPSGLCIIFSCSTWHDVGNASAGFGDTVTFGLTKTVRGAFGINDVNYCSAAYAGGKIGGAVVGGLAGGAVVSAGATAFGVSQAASSLAGGVAGGETETVFGSGGDPSATDLVVGGASGLWGGAVGAVGESGIDAIGGSAFSGAANSVGFGVAGSAAGHGVQDVINYVDGTASSSCGC